MLFNFGSNVTERTLSPSICLDTTGENCPGTPNVIVQRKTKVNLHSSERQRLRDDFIEVFKWVKRLNTRGLDTDGENRCLNTQQWVQDG